MRQQLPVGLAEHFDGFVGSLGIQLDNVVVSFHSAVLLFKELGLARFYATRAEPPFNLQLNLGHPLECLEE
jgi:hypothetical protein